VPVWVVEAAKSMHDGTNGERENFFFLTPRVWTIERLCTMHYVFYIVNIPEITFEKLRRGCGWMFLIVTNPRLS